MFEDHVDCASEVISETEFSQFRFVVTDFRDKCYLGIREYYKDFDGEWRATHNGFTVEYSLDATAKLFHAFVSLLSECEVSKEIINWKPTSGS